MLCLLAETNSRAAEGKGKEKSRDEKLGGYITSMWWKYVCYAYYLKPRGNEICSDFSL